MNKPIPHGTLSGYGYHKCRCDACRSASAEAGRHYRKANPQTERKRRWREANPEKVLERERRYREANPEMSAEKQRRYHKAHREEVLERQRRYREKNPEKLAEIHRRYRKANAQKRYEGFLRWIEANPERAAEIRSLANQRRRARQRGAFVEDVPRMEIFERDGWQCKIPGCLFPGIPASLDVSRNDPLLASIDHVIPLAKGGLHERANCVCAHLRCNGVKQDRIEGIA